MKKMIEIMDTVTIDDDKELLVVNKTKYNNKDYYLLVNRDNSSEVLIAYIDNNELVSIEDKNEYLKIIQLFDIKNVINLIPKELLDQINKG